MEQRMGAIAKEAGQLVLQARNIADSVAQKGSPRILDTVCGASKNDYSTQTWIGLSSESENNIR